MIHYRTEEEIALIRESSLLVGKTLAEVARHLRPGITGLQIDKLADEFIRDHGATPSFKNYSGYPYSVCFSVNEQVVHGFPSNEEIREGDVVSVDCGVYMNGFHGDSAYTFAVGEIPERVALLLRTTRESLEKAIEQAVDGKRIGDIGYAVQSHAEAQGFTVVRELVGHGLGRNLHEAPEVPNYGKRGNGIALKPGMVLAIEPMINMGKRDVKTLRDGWTIVTRDGMPSAHFEHDIVVRKEKAEVLSTFGYIEEALKQNSNLTVS
jgi:methionyl aminopeptidase